MAIIRIRKKENQFTVIENSIIDDQKLDRRYLGVLVTLIREKEGNLTPEKLAELYPENTAKFYVDAINKLMELGYVSGGEK